MTVVELDQRLSLHELCREARFASDMLRAQISARDEFIDGARRGAKGKLSLLQPHQRLIATRCPTGIDLQRPLLKP